jgi:hypothetical protein
MTTTTIRKPTAGRSNFRLLKKACGVWKITDDRITAKTPAVGGVLLTNQEFPPSKLDAPPPVAASATC